MKYLFVFFMALGLAMSFPTHRDDASDPEELDPKELEDSMTDGESSSSLQVNVFIVFSKWQYFCFLCSFYYNTFFLAHVVLFWILVDLLFETDFIWVPKVIRVPIGVALLCLVIGLKTRATLATNQN